MKKFEYKRIYHEVGYRELDMIGEAGSELVAVAVTTDATNSEVIYNISPCQFRSLPKTGILLLNIAHSPAAGSEGYPVSIATTPANSTTTTSSKTPLINGSGDQMLSSEITQGNRYLIFYDKCNGTFQTINHIVPPTAAASNSGE